MLIHQERPKSPKYFWETNQKWNYLANNEKEQRLVPLQVEDLSHQQKEFQNAQTKHYKN